MTRAGEVFSLSERPSSADVRKESRFRCRSFEYRTVACAANESDESG